MEAPTISYADPATLICGVCQPMPDLTPDEDAALRADIAEHGVRDPVDIASYPEYGAQPVVLDGNNRVRIAAALGQQVPVRTVDVAQSDAIAYAVRANATRRHMTAAQRRELIAAELERDPARSDVVVARVCGCSDKTVATVRKSRIVERSEYSEHATDVRVDSSGRTQPDRKPRPSATERKQRAEARAAEKQRLEDEARAAQRLEAARTSAIFPGTPDPAGPPVPECSKHEWVPRCSRCGAAHPDASASGLFQRQQAEIAGLAGEVERLTGELAKAQVPAAQEYADDAADLAGGPLPGRAARDGWFPDPVPTDAI